MKGRIKLEIMVMTAEEARIISEAIDIAEEVAPIFYQSQTDEIVHAGIEIAREAIKIHEWGNEEIKSNGCDREAVREKLIKAFRDADRISKRLNFIAREWWEPSARDGKRDRTAYHVAKAVVTVLDAICEFQIWEASSFKKSVEKYASLAHGYDTKWDRDLQKWVAMS